MSEDGKNIVNMFSELRKVCQEVSQLLSTCDSLVKEEGWAPPPKYENVALANHSATIYAPASWLPYYVFRLYENELYPGILAFVSVILDNANEKKPDKIQEALLTAGFYDYGKDKGTKDWWYSYTSIHLYMDEPSDESRWSEADLKEIWPKEKNEGVKVSTFGIPLTEIKSTEELCKEVIRPLLSRIKGKREIQ